MRPELYGIENLSFARNYQETHQTIKTAFLDHLQKPALDYEKQEEE